MRYDALSSWQKALEHTSFVTPSSVLMISAEPYTLELAWQALLEHLRRMPRWSPQGLCLFDGEEGGSLALFEELQTPPFLVPIKVIVLRRAEEWPLQERKRLDALLAARATQEKGRKSPTYVIIMASSWNKNSALYTACQDPSPCQGALLEVAVEKGFQRETTWGLWLQQRMQRHGKNLPLPLAKKWVRELADPSYLSTECDKLLAYVGQRAVITQADLDAICSLAEPESIWQLGEAIFKGDCAKALSVMDFLLSGELSPFALLASLRHQLQTGCRIAELLAANVPHAHLAAQFPKLVGKLLENQCRLAKEYGVNAFHRALHGITELEFALKDRSIDPKRLMERLIFFLSKRAEINTCI